MRLTDILSADRVAVQPSDRELSGKTAALGVLATLLAKAVGADAGAVQVVLEEREGLQSTGIGEGVAIPHGFMGELPTQVAALLVVRDGVAFDAIDNKPARIILGVVGPKKGMNAQVEHLRILARVSRVLREASLREKIVAATDAAAVYQLVSDADDRVP